MMGGAVSQRQRISIFLHHGKTAGAIPRLLVGHTDCAIIDGIGIAIGRIVKIEFLLCKIQPSILVKILCVILPDRNLEISLPLRDHFMIRLSSGSEVVWIINPLLMIIDMDLRQPLIV